MWMPARPMHGRKRRSAGCPLSGVNEWQRRASGSGVAAPGPRPGPRGCRGVRAGPGMISDQLRRAVEPSRRRAGSGRPSRCTLEARRRRKGASLRVIAAESCSSLSARSVPAHPGDPPGGVASDRMQRCLSRENSASPWIHGCRCDGEPMKCPWAALLVVTSSIACEEAPLISSEPWVECTISWSGTRPTDASAFGIQACWNGRCSDDIAVDASPADAGVGVEPYDAGCVPTTPGGLPSRCSSNPPRRPGCNTGSIRDGFSVHACAVSNGDGTTTFSVVLSPGTARGLGSHDQLSLSIDTAAGVPLVRGTATTPADADPGRSACRGASFSLD